MIFKIDTRSITDVPFICANVALDIPARKVIGFVMRYSKTGQVGLIPNMVGVLQQLKFFEVPCHHFAVETTCQQAAFVLPSGQVQTVNMQRVALLFILL